MNRDQFRERVLSEIEGVYPRAFGRESQLSLVAKIPASTSVGRRVGPNVAVEHSYTGIDITNVEDLLSLEDFQFVRCCYLALLNRDPDEIGFQANLNTLRNGTVDRLGLIRVFRESPEGKTVKAKLKGLRSITLLRKLERIPLIGPGIRLLADLARVSKLRQRIEQLESRVDRTTTLIRGSESPNDESTDQFDYDQFYLEFENHFRGDRETIKTRQSFYIPIVQELRRSLGKYPVLDISCGRGEWLCLLKENQIEAEGVDINAASLAECRIRNLNVRHNDAFRFLGDIEDGTYLVVTAFHFVEHLPLTSMIKLVDEIRRVLIPGGKIILETPNPSNLNVGAHTFYLDPTHRNPLPDALLKFIVSQRGFTDVVSQGLQAPEERNVFKNFEGAEVLNRLLFDCQDYCVIGTK